jgi:hypothetical protein
MHNKREREMETTRIEYKGRTYDVVTDEAKREKALSLYAQVYRVRKDGKPGRRITTGSIIFAVLRAAQP